MDWDIHHGNGTQHLFESDPRYNDFKLTKITECRFALLYSVEFYMYSNANAAIQSVLF